MRKRFEPQTELGKLLMEDTPTPKSRDGTVSLIIALRELYKTRVHRNRILIPSCYQITYKNAG
jgi:hypothetical protein